MTVKRAMLLLLAVVVIAGGTAVGLIYRHLRIGYDAYRALVQPGITIAGVPVGWRTEAEARDQITETVAQPYYRDILLHYQDQTVTLSPDRDLGLHIPLDDLVEEAMAASHQYDYWPGFWSWVRGDVEVLDLDVPLRMTLDESAAERFLDGVAERYDIAPVDPRVDEETLTFLPGSAGRNLDVEQAARLVNDSVVRPDRREITLPVSVEEPDLSPAHIESVLRAFSESYDRAPVEPMVNVAGLTFLPGAAGHYLDLEEALRLIGQNASQAERGETLLPVKIVEPDQSRARIESMLSTLVPVMEQQPVQPSMYTATVPLSTTGGLAGTPLVEYTGELTWTFPHFVSYTGALTSTYGYFVRPGEAGLRFDLEHAVDRVEAALEAGESAPLTFEPELDPPPPLTPEILVPVLEERLAEFPGVTSLLVKNLDTGEKVYESNVDYVLSGMSVVKLGIMVEVYRYYGGVVDAQTHQELLDMLGSESCNPCANRLLAAVGGGSAQAGAVKVTNTMRQIGLANFRLCGPFRVVEGPRDDGQIVWASYAETLLLPIQAQAPRYDNCVKATPREMARLLEMIYDGTQDRGLLREMYPAIEPQAFQEMVDIMAANDLRNMLGAGIPAEVKLAHKHGFAGYDVPWGDTRAEVGIVFSPGATWLISFYIWEDTPWINYGVMQPLYRDVSNMLYNYFNPEEPYWPLPPWTPPPDEA